MCSYWSHIFGRRLGIRLSLLPFLQSSLMSFICLWCTLSDSSFICTILLLLLLLLLKCLLKDMSMRHISPMCLFQSQSMGRKPNWTSSVQRTTFTGGEQSLSLFTLMLPFIGIQLLQSWSQTSWHNQLGLLLPLRVTKWVSLILYKSLFSKLAFTWISYWGCHTHWVCN